MSNRPLGVRAHDLAADSIEALISRLRKYQLSAIQLAPTKSFPKEVSDINAFSLEQASYYGACLREAKIEVTVLGCYVNLSSYDTAVRQDAIETFCHYIDLASSLNAKFVGTETGSVLTGYTQENYSEEAYELMIASLQTIARYGERQGVSVALEAGINHPLHDVATIERVLVDCQSDNLVVLFDLVNLLTEVNSHQQQELLEASFASFGHKIKVIHLKDCQFIEGEKVTFPLGQGVVDYPLLMSYIRKMKEQPQLLLDEIPEGDLAMSIRFLQSWL